MPTKTQTFSLVMFLMVAAGLCYAEVLTGMWKRDLMAIGVTISIVTGFAALYHVTRRLKISFKPTEAHFNWLLFGAIGTFVADASVIVIIAFTIGYKPWLVWIVGPIFLIGLAFLAALIMCRARINAQQEEGV